MTKTSVNTDGNVMASSPVSSSDFLSKTNRVLHPRNYARAQELKAKGMEVSFDPNTKTTRVSVDVSGIKDAHVLNQIGEQYIKQGAGNMSFYRSELDTYNETEIYKFKGIQNGKAVFEFQSMDATDAMQHSLDVANGKLKVQDAEGKSEPGWTFEQALNRLINNEKSSSDYK